ncbi:MAG TPA: glycosyltransferase family A protein [Mariniphaga sp.]|nr:glycosyltransferase family A protein [Mariniphaga sp.]
MIPTLSFCITCKNRFHQISRTLKKNLDDNRLHQEWIEFVLIDFGSVDGLREWVIRNFRSDLETGFLRYFYTEQLPYWHASVAKNIAHRLAGHDILINLDCDNYTGYLGGQFVIRQFLKNRDIVLHQFSGVLSDGSFGRIGMLRKYFEITGGYNESFEPMSYQDVDLIERLKRLGLEYQLKPNARFCKAIANTKNEGILYTNSSIDYNAMQNNNAGISKENINAGHIVVRNRYCIDKDLQDYKSNKMV